jgi:hypothetical protein
VVAVLFASPTLPAGASAWAASLAGGSTGLGQAGSLTAPTGVASSCVTGTTTITVTWTAAGHATSYTVLQATDSTPYAAAATGVTGTSWTSGPLPNGYNYYYELTANNGSWSSTPTTPTPRRYVAGGACS